MPPPEKTPARWYQFISPIGVCRAQSLPPSGGRWHPASHGSRMTDEGGVSITDSYTQQSACRNAPSSACCARHLLPKGRRLWRSAKPSPPSGGRWHPASHGSRMTDEGAYRSQIRILNGLLVGTPPHPPRCARHLPPEGGRLCRSPGKLPAPPLRRSPIVYCLLPVASTIRLNSYSASNSRPLSGRDRLF